MADVSKEVCVTGITPKETYCRQKRPTASFKRGLRYRYYVAETEASQNRHEAAVRAYHLALDAKSVPEVCL